MAGPALFPAPVASTTIHVLRRMNFSRLLTILVLLGVPARAEEPQHGAADIEFFEKSIRPLLVEHCYSCHAADAKTVQGGLRLDTAVDLVTGGDSGPAVVEGAPDESLLIDAVRYGPESLQMPPKGKLPDAAIELLTEWVRRGAAFPPSGDLPPRAEAGIDMDAGRQFWSFQPVMRQPLPGVQNIEWPRGQIDYFTLAAMEREGLMPAPEADRATLLRRLSFDLTGLPPTPEELRRFSDDPRPDAYELEVERLLSSPAYGERWARMWLDWRAIRTRRRSGSIRRGRRTCIATGSSARCGKTCVTTSSCIVNWRPI